MQTIETKYHGPTNTRGPRISATASVCRARVWVEYDHALNAENNHKAAAQKLMEALDWTGQYVGGHTLTGMVFVDADPDFSPIIAR
jgi:hypothetical protein